MSAARSGCKICLLKREMAAGISVSDSSLITGEGVFLGGEAGGVATTGFLMSSSWSRSSVLCRLIPMMLSMVNPVPLGEQALVFKPSLESVEEGEPKGFSLRPGGDWRRKGNLGGKGVVPEVGGGGNRGPWGGGGMNPGGGPSGPPRGGRKFGGGPPCMAAAACCWKVYWESSFRV